MDTKELNAIIVCVFEDSQMVILLNFLLYVDDMLVIRTDTNKIGRLKQELSDSFVMKDFGLESKY